MTLHFTEMDLMQHVRGPPKRSNLCLESLPLDVVCEILGHLSVGDIVRARRVCRSLWQATFHRCIWIKIYKRSKLLLPKGPLTSQSTSQLELSLIRATKFHLNWTSPRPSPKQYQRYPRTFPTYGLDTSVIFGRYLQVTEKGAISWYDLDSSDAKKPILTYSCPTIEPMDGLLKYHNNADAEGQDVVWICFLARLPRRICVLKVDLLESGLNVEPHTELEANNVIAVHVGCDWLIPTREFRSPSDATDIFHIPSRTTVYLPMHEKMHNMSNLLNVKYAITPRLLFLMITLRSETLVDVYDLPELIGITSPTPQAPAPKRLARSHSATYPHAISEIRVVGVSFDQPVDGPTLDASSKSTSISFLALAYLSHLPTPWTSQIGLHMFDAILRPDGALAFVTRCRTILKTGVLATSLALSAQGSTCLAVTHSLPGSVILAHRIQRHEDSEYTMTVEPLKCLQGLKSRQLLAFDGFRGRLCLISGWTNIDIIDYA